MEECEALCGRSSIMVNGVFRCLGSNRSIRERYGGGFELMAKIGPGKAPAGVQKRGGVVWEDELEDLLKKWGLDADAKLNKARVTQMTKEDRFVEAAAFGPTSPFAGDQVTAKVLAEWWIVTKRFQVLHAFLVKQEANTELLEWHGPMAKYKLRTKKTLGDIFELMEREKENLKVADYSLSATTLEQIFNTFAREQEDRDFENNPGQQVQANADLSHFLELAAGTAAPSTAASSAGSNGPPYNSTSSASPSGVELSEGNNDKVTPLPGQLGSGETTPTVVKESE
jgi:hypothetical protein